MPGWVFGGAALDDVANGRSRAVNQILVEVAQILDVRPFRRVIDDRGNRQEWNPRDLRVPRIRGVQVAKVQLGIVVLDVELPAHTGALQAVEDRRHLDALCGDRFTLVGIQTRDPELVIGQAAPDRR